MDPRTPRHPPEEPQQVLCEICLKEIPRSVAMSHEAQDYVLHFCGYDCYAEWQRKNNITPDTGKTR